MFRQMMQKNRELQGTKVEIKMQNKEEKVKKCVKMNLWSRNDKINE